MIRLSDKDMTKKVMRLKNHVLLAFCLLMVLFVGACGSGSSGGLGFDREIPDEFVIIRQRALTVPPDLFLRPPRSLASDYDLGVAGVLDDIDGIVGERYSEKEKNFQGSEALAAFLKRLGVFEDIPPNIREIIDEEQKARLN